MPGYPWLAEAKIDGADLQARMRALRTLGDPYSDAQIAGAADAVLGQDRARCAGRLSAGTGRDAPIPAADRRAVTP